MMPAFADILWNNAAYICFALMWVAHFFVARSYGKVSRIVQKQSTAKPRHASAQPKEGISVVITTHNQADALQRNLPWILRQDYDQFEVIVVNSDSTDDTEDVLKLLELKHGNLRHTFTPAGARHISHERLSLTVGIKSAQYEWLLITGADCRPCTPRWLASMASHFTEDTQMVLGYANYAPKKGLLSRKVVFYDLFHQMRYLTWALRHKPYSCSPANLAYRKSYFMCRRGFADDVNLEGGTAELLVNRNSTPQNAAVSFHPDSRVECEGPGSAKQWRLKRAFYVETRKHFKKTIAYRLAFHLKQATIPLFYCASIAAIGWSVWQEQWYATAVTGVMFIVLCVLKTVWFNRSSRALGERPYRLSFPWYESRITWWHLCSRFDHGSAPRAQFYRKAF